MDYLIRFETRDSTIHEVQVDILAERIKLAGLVSPLQIIFNKIIEIETHNKKVSCKKGCSFCCVQMIPLSIPEVFYLSHLVENLPAQHQKRVKQRFAKNKSILYKAGLLDKLKSPKTVRNLDADYFELGLACPFLEAGSCSIYQERPFVCREYYVLSQPELCTRPYNSPLEKLKIPLNIGALLAVFAGKLTGLSSMPVAHIIHKDWVESFCHLEKLMFPGKWMLDQLLTALRQVKTEDGDIKRIL